MLSRKSLAAAVRFIRNPERWCREVFSDWNFDSTGDHLVKACGLGAYYYKGLGKPHELEDAHRNKYMGGFAYFNDHAKDNREVCRRMISLGKGLPKGV